MFDVVLYQPEIPPNTGNVIRLCANTGCSLHLVHPLGFSLDEKHLRRAGLDYHDMTDVHEYPDWAAYLARRRPPRIWCFTTRGGRGFDAVAFAVGDALVFGPETRGLPEAVLRACGADAALRIPMRAGNRSLNLSNAVAVSVYEAWRQLGYPGRN